MGQFFDEIPPHQLKWIAKQHMCWVATCPLAADGHVNLSPKGLDGTFHIVDATRVWYEDLTGSGIETISHLRENGRITVLFHAFEGPPRIVRIFGHGTVHEFGTPEYDALIPPLGRKPGSRAAIVIDVVRVGTSCGYSIPFYTFRAHRNQLLAWCAKKEGLDNTEAKPRWGMKAWWAKENTASMDGLPGLRSAHEEEREFVSEERVYGTDDISVKPQEVVARTSAVGVDSRVTFVAGLSLGVLLTVALARVNNAIRV